MREVRRFFAILHGRFAGTELTTISVAIAFYLLLSLFPLLIALGNLLPFFNIDPGAVVGYLDTIVPKDILPVLEPIIHGVFTSASGGLLSFGVIVAIWSASKGVAYVRKGVNRAYGLADSASVLATRFISVLTILLVMLLLMVFVLFFSFGEMIFESLAASFDWLGTVYYWAAGLKWPVSIGFLFCLLALVYRFTPSVKLRLAHVMPGAAFATAGLLLLAQVFTLFLRFSARRFSSYGALGAFFALMFWLNFSAMIVLAGAVLNAGISEYRFGAACEERRVETLLEKWQQRLVARLKKWFGRKKPPSQ